MRMSEHARCILNEMLEDDHTFTFCFIGVIMRVFAIDLPCCPCLIPSQLRWLSLGFVSESFLANGRVKEEPCLGSSARLGIMTPQLPSEGKISIMMHLRALSCYREKLGTAGLYHKLVAVIFKDLANP